MVPGERNLPVIVLRAVVERKRVGDLVLRRCMIQRGHRIHSAGEQDYRFHNLSKCCRVNPWAQTARTTRKTMPDPGRPVRKKKAAPVRIKPRPICHVLRVRARLMAKRYHSHPQPIPARTPILPKNRKAFQAGLSEGYSSAISAGG